MNLLVTGAWSGAKENIKKLEVLGHQICFMQFEGEKLPCSYEWVEGVICNGLFLTHNIEKFLNLRYIQLTSAGFDRVPMDYVKKKGIKINNARGVYSIPMAEFAILGVLQLYKQAKFFLENQMKPKWEKHRGLLEVYGKRVCIIGCGNVGTECAIRFKAFGCKVIGVDLFPRDDLNYDDMVSLSKLDEQLSVADVIILTLPLTENTKYIMNRERFAILKKTSVIVNISRGAVVDMEALIEVLPTLGGAVLDVFEEEPLDNENPLWHMRNVIITPHNSFVGDGNKDRMTKVVFERLEG